MELNAQEILTFIIAVGGFVGTIALLILNLKIALAMNAMKAQFALDLTKIELGVANLRTEAATDRASLYEKIMDNMHRVYITRETQEAMHEANKQRLDAIEKDLTSLSVRIADIG